MSEGRKPGDEWWLTEMAKAEGYPASHDAHEGKDAERGEQRQQVENHAANSNVQRELDHRLLEMCNGQLRALATVVNRHTMGDIIAALVCAGLMLWTLQTANMRCDALLERIATLEANQKATAEKVEQSAKSAEAYAERASKHVWELKTALKLKFSQQRSAETPDGEM